MISEKMTELGKNRSVIREIFEYSKKRAAEIGAENVFDFSLGNPNVPAPEEVHQVFKELLDTRDDVYLFGYTSAQGDLEVRKAIADDLNRRFQTNFRPDNFYLRSRRFPADYSGSDDGSRRRVHHLYPLFSGI